MAKITYAHLNSTGGESSPRLNGRTDVAKQRNGLRVCENMQVVVHGGLRKRSGTQFVCDVTNEEQVLQPFNYSTEDSYMLLVGPGYIWIARNRGLVTHTAKTITAISKAATAVVTSNSHGFQNGDKVMITSVAGMTEVNNRVFTVANQTAHTFELSGVNSTAYTTYSSGGSAAKLVTVTTPYTANDLQELRFAQYNDVMYITHKDYAVRKLSRVSNTSWTLDTVQLTTGPFRTLNGDAEKVMTIAPRTLSVTAATKANPCVVTVSGTMFFEVGDTVSFAGVGGMTQLNSNAYEVTAVNGQDITLSVDSSAFGTYTSGGTIASAVTMWGTYYVGAKLTLNASWGPFEADHVGSIWRLSEAGGGPAVAGPSLGLTAASTLNNGDVYTSGGNVYGISDRGAVSDWRYINRVPEHTSGAVKVTGARDNNTFISNFLHPGYCVVQITGYVSATQVRATLVRFQMPESVIAEGTSFWEEGAWSEVRGYPRCCAFFEQRLWLGGSDSEPAVIWSSRSGGFEDFTDGPDDADAIIYRAASGQADTIRWLSGGRVLTAGTSHGEYAIAASNQNEALTPSNVRMLLQTTYGTSDCPPIRVNEAVLYPQRDGNPGNPSRKVREFTYDFTADTFNSVDVTVFAEHVTGSGFSRMAYQMQPDPMIWCVRDDGKLAVCTYERLQEVIAWQRHTMGGVDAAVKSIGVCPGPYGDDVWILVTRTVDGGTVKYLEVFHPPFEPTIHSKADAKMLDACLTYSGSSTTSITGLWHLRGQSVSILNNGNVETGTVSSAGTLTLQVATTKAHIGLGYRGIVETHDLEGGAQAGTAQSRIKRVSAVYTRLLGSLGGTCGQPRQSGDLDPLIFRTPYDVMGSSPDLFDGLIEMEFKGDYGREAMIRYEHDEPLPFFITAVVAELNTQG